MRERERERGRESWGKIHCVAGCNETGYITAHAQFALSVFWDVPVCVFKTGFWVAPEEKLSFRTVTQCIVRWSDNRRTIH
jgi:hypothetical protein